MTVAGKLQIKPGRSVAVLVFVLGRAALDSADVAVAVEAAGRDALAWVPYPKDGQLSTDLNRDSLAVARGQRGVRPVRQVSIDGTWSALRFRPALRFTLMAWTAAGVPA